MVIFVYQFMQECSYVYILTTLHSQNVLFLYGAVIEATTQHHSNMQPEAYLRQ